MAVDVESPVGAGAEIVSLAAEANPVVEARLGLVGFSAHVPFADEGGVVAGLLEILREEARALWCRHVVVDDFVPVHVLAGEDPRPAGRAERGGDEGVFEMDAAAGKGVDVRSFDKGMPAEAEDVVAEIVDEDEDDVAGFVERGVSAAEFLEGPVRPGELVATAAMRRSASIAATDENRRGKPEQRWYRSLSSMGHGTRVGTSSL